MAAEVGGVENFLMLLRRLLRGNQWFEDQMQAAASSRPLGSDVAA